MTQRATTALMWFRTDLRVDDNTALRAAMTAHPRVAAVFYAAPEQWRGHDMAPAKADFLWRNLAELRTALAALNVPLTVRVVPRFDDIAADLTALAGAQKCNAVYANREYPVDELRRDRQAEAALAAAGIAWFCCDDATLLPPGAVRTRQGEPFKVFTPFKRALLTLVGDDGPHCQREPKPAAPARKPPPLPANPYEAGALPAAPWPAGEAAARQRLRQFIEERGPDYHRQRDFPALTGTSQLSPYLALGVISVRRCLEAALAHNGGRWSGGDEGLSSWINELLWREFYQHVLAQFPDVSKHRPLRPETERVRWRDDAHEFARWCEGRTGYPLVDAAMRQLVQTGWMHNRLRMVTAMFLSKYLLLDWRRGEAFFMRHLIDGDLAANNGGWQWSASTGTDSVPYFRLLSPLRQAERFDADGAFCKRFLPELAEVPAKLLREPGHPALLATGYPPPMVDLRDARSRCLDAFAAAQRHSGEPQP